MDAPVGHRRVGGWVSALRRLLPAPALGQLRPMQAARRRRRRSAGASSARRSCSALVTLTSFATHPHTTHTATQEMRRQAGGGWVRDRSPHRAEEVRHLKSVRQTSLPCSPLHSFLYCPYNDDDDVHTTRSWARNDVCRGRASHDVRGLVIAKEVAWSHIKPW